MHAAALADSCTRLPSPKGVLSTALCDYLVSQNDVDAIQLTRVTASNRADFHLALWVLYQLHGTGFVGISARHEWNPNLIDLRGRMEDTFEHELRSRFTNVKLTEPFGNGLFAYISTFESPSVAQFAKTKATVDQMTELLMYRSIYHLHESDHSSWLIPRLPASAKAALAELQFGEFGQGSLERIHAEMFRRGMRDSGLDPRTGAYVSLAPVEVLEFNNIVSMFGLHGRFLGAALGHLAAFEATSSDPSRKMAQGLSRLDFPDSIIRYYQEHIEADAVHEQLVIRLMCEPLAVSHPELIPELVFGAFTCMDTERRFAHVLLEKWDHVN